MMRILAADKRESEKSLPILNTVLNGLDAIIMATVPETGEILFINDRKKELFGVRGDARAASRISCDARTNCCMPPNRAGATGIRSLVCKNSQGKRGGSIPLERLR